VRSSVQIEQFRQTIIELEQEGELIETPCDEGTMPFRIWRPWGDQLGGETLVFLHGGSGSWTHWIRNIKVLSNYYDIVVPDLPGLGDASSLPDGYQPHDAARWTAMGIEQILGDHQGKPQRYHLIGFSWGCVPASLIAAQHGDLIKSLILVGPAAMGEMSRHVGMEPLIPRTREMSEDKIRAANRENLARLMIHDRKKIDDFSVFLQTENTYNARFSSPQFAKGTYVLDGIKTATAPLLVMYGEFDAPAYPNISTRRDMVMDVRPDASFEVIPDTGHWLQYESSEVFNTRCVQWIEQHIF